MDQLKLTQVPRMLLSESANGAGAVEGSLHLTVHHIIFRAEGKKELWIALPLLFTCTRLPSNLTGTSHPILLRLRTFKSFHLTLPTSDSADGLWDSLKALASSVAHSGIEACHAFYWEGQEDRVESGWKGKQREGWRVYEEEREWERMGMGRGEGARSQAWRVSTINSDFEFCPSYPANIVVPSKISDTTLSYAVKYRSKGRIPGLVYLHWANHGSITRSSQPMVGITQGARSIQDEKLIEAIFSSHAQHTKTRAAFSSGYESPSGGGSAAGSPGGEVYGAQATNVIIDARPSKNAYANSVKGAGTENMAYYKNCKKEYLGIDNIHVMRASLNDIHAALRDADATGTVDRYQLNRSGWLGHLTNILDGVLLIVKTIHLSNSHVLVHCSDGWDRTSQLSALPQLCLDPYYRTARGLAVLIEKDWVSYGHRFSDRSGVNCGDRVVFTSPPAEGTSAQASFLASVQKQFAGSSHAFKETCPVFQQFLDCANQLLRQFPTRFEWNASFLVDLNEEVYAGRSGTFLFNSEKQRVELRAADRTHSVWESFFNISPEGELKLKDKYRNENYDTSLDDPDRRTIDADQGVLLPQPTDVKWWFELFGRSDEEMNGRPVPPEELARLREESNASSSLGADDLGIGSLRVAARDTALAPPLASPNGHSPGQRSLSPGVAVPDSAQLAEVVGSVQKWGWGALKSVQKGYQDGVKQYRESQAPQTPTVVAPQAVEDPWRSAHAPEASNSGWKADEGADEMDATRSVLNKAPRKPLAERLSEIARSKVPSNPWATEKPAASAVEQVKPTQRSSAPAREAIARPAQSNGAPPAPAKPNDDAFDPLAGLAAVMSSPAKMRQAPGANPWAVKSEMEQPKPAAGAAAEGGANGATNGSSDPLGVGPL